MSYPNHGGVWSNGNGTHGFLPPSAPVSSLLPPITTSYPEQQSQLQHQQPHSRLAAVAALTATGSSSNSSVLHHQLAAFLQGNATPSVPQQPQQPQLSHQQLLALSQVQQASWSLDQLEQHVALLQRSRQPIPPNTALLLANARKRAEKRHAKRMANRKSACTSRARKKALLQEMTELNLRLRRQALILSLLPDMVIAIDPQGRITFCSAQAENVIRRSIEHELIGANMSDILVPGSQKELQELVQQLLGKKRTQQDAPRDGKPATNKSSISGKGIGERMCKKHKSGPGKGDDSDKLVQQAFPLKVVQVDADRSDENGENSDGSKQPPSSLTNSSALDVNSGGSDNDNTVSVTGSNKNSAKANTATTSNDCSSDSVGPSLSANPNRSVVSANTNLERNVRWHNKNRNMKHSGYKDDVNGAAVTANNASARLSSLQHLSSSSEEDDSGYRESNESREETSSSSSEGESCARQRRRRVLAPACNVCLIRKDLTTIWCEVTSSVRSKETDQADCSCVASTKNTPLSSSSVNESKPGPKKRSAEEANLDEDALEILLCLRPIHDGESCCDKSSGDSKQQRIVSEVNTSCGGDDAAGMTGEDSPDSKLAAMGDSSDSMSSSHKGGTTSRDRKETSGRQHNTDDSAVETLIAMSKNP